jgi:hypothetical protein
MWITSSARARLSVRPKPRLDQVRNPALIAERDLQLPRLHEPPQRRSRGQAGRSEDQRPDWIERERNACAEPKGGGWPERVAGICVEREGGGCAGRAAARARLFASYRPTTHPVAAPNIVGQRPAGRAVPASRPRPTKWPPSPPTMAPLMHPLASTAVDARTSPTLMVPILNNVFTRSIRISEQHNTRRLNPERSVQFLQALEQFVLCAAGWPLAE